MLEKLESQGMLRRLPEPLDREAAPGPLARIGGRELTNLVSNNYLGLATDPRVIEASCEAVRAYGAGATGSRLLSGNLELHERLERELARFKGAESALLLNSGYAANLSLLTALAGPGDRIVSDKLNHASLVDGARASEAEARWYRHGDLARAEELLAGSGAEPTPSRKLLVTDAVFSMDGDLADLPALLAICRRQQAWLVLDEAHSTGVLGGTGRGIFEHFGLAPDPAAHGVPGIVRMGTLGKALGGFGAFVACDARTREVLVNRARPFIFSTALPPAVLGAALGALEVLSPPAAAGAEAGPVSRLGSNVARFRAQLADAGFEVDRALPTPIIPLVCGSPERALAFAEAARERGVLALAIRPPTVPPGTSRLRLSVMATHEPAQLERAAEALREAREEAWKAVRS